jgi:transketolase
VFDGEIENWFTDDSVERFNSYGWQTLSVDGHDVDAINGAIESAKAEKDMPTMIFCRTTIGFGSPNKSGTSDVHGAPLGEEEIAKTRESLGWSYEPFVIPNSVSEFWDSKTEGIEKNSKWDSVMDSLNQTNPEKYTELMRRISGNTPDGFSLKYKEFLNQCDKENKPMATRKASQVCLDFFVEEMPELLGGSADLTPSNNTFSKASSEFFNDNPAGNHINYGVREFGMSAIMNGMVLHGGVKPYGATFLVFTDYARNAIRLSALMGLPNIFVYTHDSIALGEDGPTHQPVEHLVTLRCIQDMVVSAPRNGNEFRHLLYSALNQKELPFSIRYPKSSAIDFDLDSQAELLPIGSWEVLRTGSDIVVLAVGPLSYNVERVAELLQNENISIEIVNCRFIKPMDESYLRSLIERFNLVITIEEGVIVGGFGDGVSSWLLENTPSSNPPTITPSSIVITRLKRSINDRK